jgi:hypothetical protein
MPMEKKTNTFSLIQLGEPGGQQLHESGFPEIRVITQEFLDGLYSGIFVSPP